MSYITLQTRYAQSLFDLSQSLNRIDEVKNDMMLIIKVCEESRTLRAVLKNPTIKPLKKRSLMQTLFTANVTEITIKFLNLLTAKRRDVYLLEIALRYVEIYKQYKGIKTVHLTLADTITNELKNQIIDLLKQELKSEIELVEKIDPTLIGGFSLEIDGNRYDASISQSINILKQAFSKNIYEGSF